jgi:hypothetical protein
LLLAALWLAYRDLAAGGGPAAPAWPLIGAEEPAYVRGPYEMARLSMAFVRSIFIVQTAALLVLTPVYLCGVIQDERERGHLALLLSSGLSDAEIILGKFLARVVHLGALLLTGLPVLCLIQFWGGVDARLLWAGYAATALSVLSVGGVSIYFAVVQPGRLSAVLMTMLTLAFLFLSGLLCPWSYLTTPLALVAEAEERAYTDLGPVDLDAVLTGMLTQYAFLHIGLAVLAVGAATRELRRQPLDHEGVNEYARALVQPNAALAGEAGATPRRPPVGDRPLLWKERYVRGTRVPRENPGLSPIVIAFASVTAPFLLLLVVGFVGHRWEETRQGFHVVIRAVALAWRCFTCTASRPRSWRQRP